jgi:hypothetical protein
MILLAALPAALTKTTPHTLRFLPAAPFMLLIVGVGLNGFINIFTKKLHRQIFVSFMIFVIATEWFMYSYDYFVVYPKRSSQDWQYGYKEVMGYLKQYKDEGRTIYFTRDLGRPSIYAFFYWLEDPQRVQAYEKSALKDQGEMLEYENIYFTNSEQDAGSIVVSTLKKENMRLLTQFNYLNNTPALYIYEN